MDKAKKRLKEVFEQYLSQSATESEKNELWNYINDPIYTIYIKDMISEVYQQPHNENGLSGQQKEIIFQNIFEQQIVTKSPKKAPAKLWLRIAAAAAILIIIGIGVFYYNQQYHRGLFHTLSQSADIAHGITGATLTLANGKNIRLSEVANGELVKEAGLVITKSDDGQLIYEIKAKSIDCNKMNTLSTAKGETYQLRLPDGSVVWLNAASSLTYSAALEVNGLRRVKLDGEAYFEISKDKSHPFIVQTNNQEVEVLGTHFNVNSYADEEATVTTLLEGSVNVRSGNQGQFLKPGFQAINNGQEITVALADVESITDWKGGDFFLDRINFKAAMRKIARWYDVEIVYASDVPDELEAGGWISRNNKLSAVLKSIEKSGIVHFKVNGRIIYVTK